MLCPGDNQSKKVNWDIKIFSKGSNKPVFGREWRATEKLKLSLNVSDYPPFYYFKNSVQYSIIFLEVATFKTIWRCCVRQDMNFQMSNHWKEGKTSASQSPGPKLCCISFHPHSRLHPRKPSLTSRGGEMPGAGQDLNSSLSNFEAPAPAPSVSLAHKFPRL